MSFYVFRISYENVLQMKSLENDPLLFYICNCFVSDLVCWKFTKRTRSICTCKPLWEICPSHFQPYSHIFSFVVNQVTVGFSLHFQPKPHWHSHSVTIRMSNITWKGDKRLGNMIIRYCGARLFRASCYCMREMKKPSIILSQPSDYETFFENTFPFFVWELTWTIQRISAAHTRFWVMGKLFYDYGQISIFSNLMWALLHYFPSWMNLWILYLSEVQKKYW